VKWLFRLGALLGAFALAGIGSPPSPADPPGVVCTSPDIGSIDGPPAPVTAVACPAGHGSNGSATAGGHLYKGEELVAGVAMKGGDLRIKLGKFVTCDLNPPFGAMPSVDVLYPGHGVALDVHGGTTVCRKHGKKTVRVMLGGLELTLKVDPTFEVTAVPDGPSVIKVLDGRASIAMPGQATTTVKANHEVSALNGLLSSPESFAPSLEEKETATFLRYDIVPVQPPQVVSWIGSSTQRSVATVGQDAVARQRLSTIFASAVAQRASGSPQLARQAFTASHVQQSTGALEAAHPQTVVVAGDFASLATTLQSLRSTLPSTTTVLFVAATPLPRIGSFSPAAGEPGTTVTILGSGLAGAKQVDFGGVSSTPVVVSDSELTTVVPAGATTAALTIAAPGGTTTSVATFTVLHPPAIASIAPTSGPPGTAVTVTGSGFTGATEVDFNGVTATFAVSSDVKLVATVPAGAASGALRIVSPGGSVTGRFLVTALPPRITGLSPTAGYSGTSVTITGSGFTGATGVDFNGTSAKFGIVSDTQLTATVPTGATTGPIHVVAPGGAATSTASYTVIPPPG
jgi:hypothetical protein